MAKTTTKPKRQNARAKSERKLTRSQAAIAKDRTFARGFKVRRDLFGPAYAEGEIDTGGDFMWVLHDMVTRYCFGDTWGRAGLEPKIRSAITLAIMVAQGRPRETKMHVKTGIKNGLTKEEIAEILLHAMVYCGVPRGSEGFRAADEMLREMGLVK